MTTDVFTICAVHEVGIGGQFTGVAPDGTDSDATLHQGRLRLWAAGTVGGQFTAHAVLGARVQQILWNAPAAAPPTVTVSVVDPAGIATLVQTSAGASGSIIFSGKGLLLPPGWAVTVASSAVCNAVGRVTVCVEPGWPHPSGLPKT
jgi:hypothetical protein